MKKISNFLIISTFFIILKTVLGQNAISVTSIGECKDTGTKTIDVSLQLINDEAIVGYISLGVLADENLLLLSTTIVIQDGSNETDHLYDADLMNACQTLIVFFGDSSEVFLSNCVEGDCMNRSPGDPICPARAGTYEVDIQKSKVDEALTSSIGQRFEYNDYQEIFQFYDTDNVLLGCFQIGFTVYNSEE